jgi:DNA-binding NarL/FixJ family response regulator
MRVVIADDSALIREGVARLLSEAGIEVVGLAGDGTTAERLVAEMEPDVAILDMRMPPGGAAEGLRVAQAIRARPANRTSVLILSQTSDASAATKLLSDRADGVGYLMKDRVADVEALVDALVRVGRGESVLDPVVVADLFRARRNQPAVGELTTREREVLSLMAEGRSNRAIGEKLTVTGKTVEAHVASIFSKLGLEPAADDHRRVLAVLAYLQAR